MAVANGSSSAALVKAVALPLVLALLAVAAGVSGTEDGPAGVAKSGGRFMETQGTRRLLQNSVGCGPGSAPDYSCKVLYPLAKNATCCTDTSGNQACWDVAGSWFDKCGSCNHSCSFGQFCCLGVCTNMLTDNNNCGSCGTKCVGNTTCKNAMCGY